MTDRLTPDQEAAVRRLALWIEESPARAALRVVLAELDAVRVELKEERQVSDLLNVQNAELMKGPRE